MQEATPGACQEDQSLLVSAATKARQAPGKGWRICRLAAVALLVSGELKFASAATVSNPGRVLILDNTNASPYPSGVVIEGVAGRITSVTATLSGLSHAFISDVDVLLVAPAGQTVLLMAHVGDMSAASNLDLTFDDSAPLLPAIGAMSAGVYRPTQVGSNPAFSAPAPAPPYGTSLSVFTNRGPNGVWNLFVLDNAAGDSGVIGGGWSLTVSTEGTAPSISPLSSLTAEEGSTMSVPARTSGDAPLSYQWFYNGSNAIAGGTRSALQFATVRAEDAGAYHVVVTNTFGAVTSAPVMLSVIPPVERSLCPGLLLTADPGTDLYLEYATSLSPSPNWSPLAAVTMGGILGPSSEWYFDGLPFSAGQRFYRAWHENDGSMVPGLEFHVVPAITLRGSVGSSFWIDYINQVGPTDAWVQLATVTLTNSSQLYLDTSAVGQPPRLYRVATTFKNLDFELAAGIPDAPGYPSAASFSDAFPGWTGYCGTNAPIGLVQYDYQWLDTAGISLLDTNSTTESVTGVQHGRYCICLYSGFMPGVYPPSYDIPVAIAQTNKIPSGVSSLLFNYKPCSGWGAWGGSEVLVTFNGIGIPLRTVSSEIEGSSVLGGDISQFAGQFGELRFTAPLGSYTNHSRNIFMLDHIRFSTARLGP